jgi:hypothetical protein
MRNDCSSHVRERPKGEENNMPKLNVSRIIATALVLVVSHQFALAQDKTSTSNVKKNEKASTGSSGLVNIGILVGRTKPPSTGPTVPPPPTPIGTRR